MFLENIYKCLSLKQTIDNKKPTVVLSSKCYTLAEFEHAAQNKRKYGENILGKFFR